MGLNYKFLDENRSTAILAFKEMQKLDFKVDMNKGWVKYGKNNLYPQDLVRLYDEHPEHRGIINRKSRYLAGKGLEAKDKTQELKVNAFIDTFNRFETLNELMPKLTTNLEMFNGVYVQVITNLQGKPIEYYLLNSANCRISEDKETLYFSKNWKSNIQDKEITKICKFNPNGKEAGTFFIEFKYYTATGNYLSSVYPTAQYQSCVNDINTDIDISTFNANYVANGFSVGTIITFFNGVPPDEMKRDIDSRFKGTYTGEKGENVMVNFVDEQAKKPEVTTIGVEELSEKFKFTSERCQKKIFIGHEMPSELFNIKFENSFLSAAPDLVILQNTFVKGYVEPRQELLLDFISYLSFLKTGEYLEFAVNPISLIGGDLSNDQDLTQDERRKLKGFEPLTAPKVDANGQPLPVQANEVDDNLKGLSASENRDMQRVIRDYQSGKNGMNEHVAIDRLKAYGLDEAKAKKWLGIMSSDDEILNAFLSCATDDDKEYVVLSKQKIKVKNSLDALKFERQMLKMANEVIITVDDIDLAILNSLKGNPNLSIEELAANLKIQPLQVTESMARLIDKKLINDSVGGFIVTDKGTKTESKPLATVETYTVYKYALDDNLPPLKTSSRKFCEKLMSASNNGKSWTFEAIDNLSNQFNMNAWDYRGGYFYNSNLQETTPYCRHVWEAEVRSRKVKK